MKQSAIRCFKWLAAALIVAAVLAFTTCDNFPLKQTIDNIVSRSIELTAPEDGARLPEKTPLLTWDSPGDADEYEVQLSLTDEFVDVTTAKVTEKGYEIPEDLIIGEVRYWRVRALKMGEDPSEWTEHRSFEIVPSQSPQVIGSLEVGGGGYRVTVQGDYAYLPRILNGISIVDISDPTSPTLAAEITDIETGHDLAVQGDYLYVVDNRANNISVNNPSSLKVYDISNPASPRLIGGPLDLLVGSLVYKSEVAAFGFWGNKLYFTAKRTNAGTVTNKYVYFEVDISNPSSPVGDSGEPIYNHGTDVAVSGGLILVVRSTSGVGIPGLAVKALMNSDDPAVYEIADMNNGLVEVYKNYACVSNIDGPVEIIDFTNANELVLAGTYDPGTGTLVGGLTNQYLYVAEYNGSEGHLLDLTNIESPEAVSTISGDTVVTYMVGNYGYTLDYNNPGMFEVIDFIPGD